MGHSAQIKLRVESDAAVREAFPSTAQGSEAPARKRQVLGIERKLSGAPHRKDALAQGLKASSQSAHLERLKSSPLNPGASAIRRIPQEEITETLALYEQLLKEAGDDIMAADVRGEIQAAGSAAPGEG